jgi:hypothetical protein
MGIRMGLSKGFAITRNVKLQCRYNLSSGPFELILGNGNEPI